MASKSMSLHALDHATGALHEQMHALGTRPLRTVASWGLVALMVHNGVWLLAFGKLAGLAARVARPHETKPR